MSTLHPSFYDVFKPGTYPHNYVRFYTDEQARDLFDIFDDAFNVKPGSEMAANYMTYPNMYVSEDTIEGRGGRMISTYDYRVFTYEEFIAEFCCQSVVFDDQQITSLL